MNETQAAHTYWRTPFRFDPLKDFIVDADGKDVASVFVGMAHSAEQVARAVEMADAPRLKEVNEALLAALEALDRIHQFAYSVEKEDWGLYEEHAIPEVRAAYIAAAAAIAQAKGVAS